MLSAVAESLSEICCQIPQIASTESMNTVTSRRISHLPLQPLHPSGPHRSVHTLTDCLCVRACVYASVDIHKPPIQLTFLPLTAVTEQTAACGSVPLPSTRPTAETLLLFLCDTRSTSQTDSSRPVDPLRCFLRAEPRSPSFLYLFGSTAINPVICPVFSP